MRRTLAAIVAPLALLAGCATDTDEPADGGTDVPPSANQSAEASVEATTQPTPEQSVEATVQTPAPEPEATASGSEEDIDVHDGVRTADFLKMPEQLGGMAKTAQESHAPEHRAIVQYEADDDMSKAQLTAYYPEVGGEVLPVDEADDDGYRGAVAKVERGFGENPDAHSVRAGGMDWDCFVMTQEFDQSLCLSLMYGRVLEVQRIAIPAGDDTARREAADENLTAMAEAIAALG